MNLRKCSVRVTVCMLAICAAVAWGVQEATAAGAPKDIKIAVAYPLSGAYARNGNLMVQGAKAAMAWINDNGGIKALGGAKLVPVIGDTGSTVEGAASAMERLCRDPEIVAAIGCWSSSLTLAATEVTERLGIPHFSISFADSLSERGFKWGFYPHMKVSLHGELGAGNVVLLAKQSGYEIKTAMIAGDTNASSLGLYKAAKKYFEDHGIKVLGEATWAVGTLTDATPVMAKIKAANPDFVVWNPSSITEAQMLLMKRKELGLKMPFGSGAMLGDSSLRQIGADAMEGIILWTPVWPQKNWSPDMIKRTLDQCKKEYSDEAWAGQELAFPWTLVPVIAEALEHAKSTDHEALRKAAHSLDVHNVPNTRALVKQGIAFDETGRVAKKYQDLMLIEWQEGRPSVIYPTELATAKPVWPKR